MSAWTYVEDDGRPANEVAVLVTFTDRGGRRRATVATYYGAKELEASCESWADDDLYDEETDKYWAPPGWYETPWSAEEVYPLDGVVVAWMPLKVAPERAPAEEPREVVEPKSAVGLAVEELRRREGCPHCEAMAGVLRAYTEDSRAMVEPAPAPAQRLTCKECCQDIPASEVYAGTHFRPDPRTGGRWPCGPVELAPAPESPAPARWRCEGCGWKGNEASRNVGGNMVQHLRHDGPLPGVGVWCGPVVPVEAGS